MTTFCFCLLEEKSALHWVPGIDYLELGGKIWTVYWDNNCPPETLGGDHHDVHLILGIL